MSTLSVSTKLRVIDCGSCGWTYGIPLEYHVKARELGHFAKTWRCPNKNCAWATVGFDGPGDVAKAEAAQVRAERDAANAREDMRSERSRHHATRRRLSAQKGVTTRIKNRVGRGVCPCCNRTFANVARHMTGQHPGYAEAEV